jgi:hypothetical protein
MKYVLMFIDTEQFSADLAASSDAERELAYERVRQWFRDHEREVTHHRYLMPPESATTVRLDGSDALVTDGPFVEGKEVVSGYAEIEVADLDEALGLAKSWPGCPVVEIRPIAS